MTKDVEQQAHSRQETMVRGMAWLTAGNFISRLLGVAYVIPWYMWMGEHAAEANGLFNMGYQVYANFLLISTVGLPAAVAKQIARYNVQGKQDTSYYLVREFLKLMVVMGAVFAGIMYVSAPWLADVSGSRDNLIPIMYSLVPPIFIFPTMSVVRGFFQGHHDMKPYALSQIVEQIVRVIWILLATYFIMKLGSGNFLEAVTQSTFAAFVGMIASVAVLLYFLYKGDFLRKIFRKKPATVTVDVWSLVLETLKEAIPIIILGMAIQIYQQVDQLTFVNTMVKITGKDRSDLIVWYSYMLANPSKITMLVIGISQSIGSVAISMITERFVQKDTKGVVQLITDNLQILFIFVIPAIVGTIVLARPLYSVFYGQAENLAINLFIVNLLLILPQSLYTVLGIVIQAIFENRKAILYFIIGFVLKLILQIPFLYLFQVYGPLLSTALGLGVSIYLFYRRIKQVVPIEQDRITHDVITISWISGIMGAVVLVVEFLLNQFLPTRGYLPSAVHIGVSGFVGLAIFVALTLKTRQLDKLIGGRAQSLRNLFKMN
ncbi:TPA: polysaccharide biosynthesis protein [Streptococcus suis]|nr:polysaccharide biosynthesis protein [Streptococcus suis]MBY5020661.1 polysaccharide biosynthesis protein [Streptococcus suis]HEL1584350.1 polysaccharide biosynthesis protein [Streptococcus suis]HEL1585470.1 polysaccharide biosynthesis protein [Streptococcus suis]